MKGSKTTNQRNLVGLLVNTGSQRGRTMVLPDERKESEERDNGEERVELKEVEREEAERDEVGE